VTLRLFDLYPSADLWEFAGPVRLSGAVVSRITRIR
jgi:hypothetical protein